MHEKLLIEEQDGEIDELDASLEELENLENGINFWQRKYSPGFKHSWSDVSFRQCDDSMLHLESENFTLTLKKLIGEEEATVRLSDFNLPYSRFVDIQMEQTEEEEEKGAKVPSLLHHLFQLGTSASAKIAPSNPSHVNFGTDNFSVSPQLIGKVEEIWSKNFFPSNVTAAPFSLDIYGPNGKFQPYEKDPETLGMFLVGLTDKSDAPTYWYTSDPSWQSINGSWFALYSNEDLKAIQVNTAPANGLVRGILAFKVFAKPSQTLPVEIQESIALLNQLEKPFGILLSHDYAERYRNSAQMGGGAAFNKFLAHLDSSQCRTQLLPTITSAEWEHLKGDYYDPQSPEATTSVRPFTEKMIRACASSSTDAELSTWPAELSGIPFITTNGWDSLVLHQKQDRGEFFTDRPERDPHPATGCKIYLTAALVVLPK